MRIIEHFFRVLAPANCLSCGDEGKIICAWCLESALPETIPRCYKCNALSRDSATCASCRRKSPIRHLWLRTEFTEISRQLIHVMKFKYSIEAAELVAAELMHTIPALPPETIVTYVPTATSHARQRGFDHAQVIVRELARRSGYKYLPILHRTGQQRQVGSSRQRRLQQMEKVFRPRQAALIRGAKVLLVDDVLTTGATIEAAAKVLKAAGAKSVDVAIFAQAK